MLAMDEARTEDANVLALAKISRVCSGLCMIPAVLSLVAMWRRPGLRRSAKALFICHFLLANALVELVRISYYSRVLDTSSEQFTVQECINYMALLIYGSFFLPAGILLLMVETGVELFSARLHSKFSTRVGVILIACMHALNFLVGRKAREELVDLLLDKQHASMSDACSFDAILSQVPTGLYYNLALVAVMGGIGFTHWLGACFGTGKTELYTSRTVMFVMMLMGLLMYGIIILTGLIPLLQLSENALLYCKTSLEIGRALFLNLQIPTSPQFKNVLKR